MEQIFNRKATQSKASLQSDLRLQKGQSVKSSLEKQIIKQMVSNERLKRSIVQQIHARLKLEIKDGLSSLTFYDKLCSTIASFRSTTREFHRGFCAVDDRVEHRSNKL